LIRASILGRASINRRKYALSVGCIESQNTNFDASEQTNEKPLHRKVVSMKPLPQQP